MLCAVVLAAFYSAVLRIQTQHGTTICVSHNPTMKSLKPIKYVYSHITEQEQIVFKIYISFIRARRVNLPIVIYLSPIDLLMSRHQEPLSSTVHSWEFFWPSMWLFLSFLSLSNDVVLRSLHPPPPKSCLVSIPVRSVGVVLLSILNHSTLHG